METRARAEGGAAQGAGRLARARGLVVGAFAALGLALAALLSAA